MPELPPPGYSGGAGAPLRGRRRTLLSERTGLRFSVHEGGDLRLLLDPAAWYGRKGASAFKAFAGAVILASERGIVDDNGNLQIGSDQRTPPECAGLRQATVSKSALPYLVQEMKLVSWRPGKGKKAGKLVLKRITKDVHTGGELGHK